MINPKFFQIFASGPIQMKSFCQRSHIAMNFSLSFGRLSKFSFLRIDGVCPEMTTVAPESVFTQPGSARWISTRLKFQNVISDYLLAQPNYMWKEKPYLLEELLWQLRNTGNLSKLVKVLTTPEYVAQVLVNSRIRNFSFSVFFYIYQIADN